MSSSAKYTLKEKVVILDKLQGRGSCSLREMAQGLGVPFAVATKIWKERQLIRRSWSSATRTPAAARPSGVTKTPLSRLHVKNTKRLSRTPGGGKRVPQIEAGVLGWYQEVMRAGGVVTQGLMQQQATSLAVQLGLSAFRASTEWLSRFTQRNKVQLVSDSLTDSLPAASVTPMRQSIGTPKRFRVSKRRLSVLQQIQENHTGGNSHASKIPRNPSSTNNTAQRKSPRFRPANANQYIQGTKNIGSTSTSSPSLEEACSALKTLERWVQANHDICNLTLLSAIRQDMNKLKAVKGKSNPKFNLYVNHSNK